MRDKLRYGNNDIDGEDTPRRRQLKAFHLFAPVQMTKAQFDALMVEVDSKLKLQAEVRQRLVARLSEAGFVEQRCNGCLASLVGNYANRMFCDACRVVLAYQ